MTVMDLQTAVRGIAIATGTIAKLRALKDGAIGLAGPVRHGLYDRDEVVDRLYEEADSCGLVEEVGADVVAQMIADGLETFDAPQPSKKNGHADQQQPRAPWTVSQFRWRDTIKIPQRAFLYGKHYARDFVSVTIGDGGTGKSATKIAECLALATGLPLLGITPTERVRALYWNGDDPYVEVERRIHAVCQHFGIDGQQLFDQGWLFMGTSDESPLSLAEMRNGRLVINTPAADDIIALIETNNIGFAAFDPFKALHRLPENANSEIDAVVDALKVIAGRTHAAIGLDHHVRKPAAGQVEVTAADARGASALINKVRLSRVVNPMTAALAEQARVKEEDRWRYFRVDPGKRNIAPPTKAAWFRLVSVPLANGDDIGVPKSWTYPGAFDAVTPDHVHRVRTMAATSSYRKDPQADNWIGKAVAEVLGLDPEDEADKKQTKTVLKVWFENGVLATEERKDPETRHSRAYVVPGNWDEEAEETATP